LYGDLKIFNLYMPKKIDKIDKKGKVQNKLQKSKKTKYVFVVGGVLSGVGKGVTTSTLALLCKSSGLNVTAIKIDPYINVDAGTMNPTEHGEVFVLGDGDECDQDMGNYERFLGVNLSRTNYMTTGRVYKSVIENERAMKYGGRCVQVVPDVPNEVIERIERAGIQSGADIVFVEIGGTIGEYENILFLEAVRMMKNKYEKDVVVVMVSYIPNPASIGEMKTKPTQHAVREINGVGIQPDIIIARSDIRLDEKRRDKIAQFCNIKKECVFSAPDVKSIYEIPNNFKNEKVHEVLLEKVGLKKESDKIKTDLSKWSKFFSILNNKEEAQEDKKIKKVKVAIVGKYFESGEGSLSDSYLSVIEAIKYSSCELGVLPIIEWLSAEDFEKGKVKLEKLKEYDAVIVPGGFGARGVEGKIMVIEYVRENKIPFLGICYGMQLAVIETMRHVAGHKDADTTEVNHNTKCPVITILHDQKIKMKNNDYGNSMRLGNYESVVNKNTIAYSLYKKSSITERHRHRYEVDPKYHQEIVRAGMTISSTSPDGSLAEIVELPVSTHPYFIACQFHPEFLARPLSPHPLFTGLIRAVINYK
jgi:CTP synthase